MPAFRAPQLATLVDGAPPGDAWIHEIKYDGYRILLAVGAGDARAYTRRGLDWSDKFTPIVEAAQKLNARTALIDGEAVVLDEQGRSSFQLMQGAFKARSAKLIYYAFDLLALDGEDLTKLPLLERKQRLVKVVGRRKTGVIRYSGHVVGHGDAAFKAACKQGLEGIVSKRANAPYISARTESWLKVKCLKRQEFVIAGWTESDKDRGFRSLILAANEHGKLRYAGKVGAGFTVNEIDRLLARMQKLAIAKAPIDAPRAAVKGAHWVDPKLVAEVTFTEMTSDGILRHPSYMGLREDKPAKEVVVERPKKLVAPRKRAKP
jgi:bifunctional non-homologous end joining protein LigD